MKSNLSTMVFDIGASNIKVLELKNNKEDITVINHLMFKTPEETYADGLIGNTNKLSQLILGKLIEKKFQSKKAIVTVSSSRILTREVVLPKCSLKEMSKLVEIEAPDNFPIDISDHYIDFKILGETQYNDNTQYVVLILVTPKEIIDSYLELFEKCGIYLEKIDFKGNSITKLIKQQRELSLYEDYKSNIVLDIGSLSSNIIICSNGIYKYSKTLTLGSGQYNKEFMEVLNCTDEEAEKIKRDYGIVSHENELDVYNRTAKQAWVKLSVPLFDELTRVIEFFASRSGNSPIDRILLTGGGSLIKNLINYMHNSYDVNIEFLNSAEVIDFNDKSIDINEFNAYFSNCVGAYF